MVSIRPFRLMLWSLLLVTAGGTLVVYGSRNREDRGVTYSEMLEGMADLSRSRAVQDNPPTLQLWDMGWFIMTIGSAIAIPGLIIMTISGLAVLVHRFYPAIAGQDHEQEEPSEQEEQTDSASEHADEEDVEVEVEVQITQVQVSQELVSEIEYIELSEEVTTPSKIGQPSTQVQPESTGERIELSGEPGSEGATPQSDDSMGYELQDEPSDTQKAQ